MHCCPFKSTCDSTSGMCQSVTNSLTISWHLLHRRSAIVALKRENDVQCPDKSFCEDKTTCCEQESGGYGCCPYPQVCCCLMLLAHTHTHTHIHFTLSGITRVSWYQNQFGFSQARDSEWQWHQLGHMQICTSPQTDNHTSTPPISFLQARCYSCRPTNSVKALKAFSELLEFFKLFVTSNCKQFLKTLMDTDLITVLYVVLHLAVDGELITDVRKVLLRVIQCLVMFHLSEVCFKIQV